MKIDVLDKNGKSTGRSVELSDDIFGIEPNEHALWLAIKQYNAHQRQGTHKAKERGEIKGSTKKIKKQKGTGTARAGSIKNPLFRGGGRVFGPRPRTYSLKLNKKVKSLAFNSALALKVKNESLKVVEDLSFEAPKTKDFISVINALGCNDQKVLFVNGTQENNKNVHLSARNLQTVNVAGSNEMNTYNVLDAQQLIISESAAAQFAAK